MSAIRQHLIDPEICIRCNTCEETCPVDAVTHDDMNYVVDASKCGYCMSCISPCPTGAIDNWRTVTEPYSIEEQFEWDELPAEQEGVEAVDSEPGDDEVSELLEIAHAGQGGRAVAPASAAQARVNMYSRQSPARAVVAGNFRITDPGAGSDTHHIVLDFGSTALPVLEGQSIGIIPPGTDENDRPHKIRLYSVCSPRDGERPNHNNVALTVKRVTHDDDGRERPGLASNYVCDLNKGDEVLVTGPFGNTFLMPNEPEANIIMVCTGTGSAPFRAMTERRRRHQPDGPGRLLLFFGARTPGELPYFGPLQKLPDKLIEKELVFSRMPDQPREYVQDRLRKKAETVASLLRKDTTYVFICGLKGMEQGVAEAFEAICADHGLDWDTLLPELRSTGRYHVETY
ncbi:MAG: benzoyl-CoA 2,3-epoxidase subunit BoxA [Gammaproteobacteria bacterium]|nr:benzoyl-CoA 2,3-epoxidase subunit BoxA [Gammaproteobacteria bacterium]